MIKNFWLCTLAIMFPITLASSELAAEIYIPNDPVGIPMPPIDQNNVGLAEANSPEQTNILFADLQNLYTKESFFAALEEEEIPFLNPNNTEDLAMINQGISLSEIKNHPLEADTLREFYCSFWDKLINAAQKSHVFSNIDDSFLIFSGNKFHVTGGLFTSENSEFSQNIHINYLKLKKIGLECPDPTTDSYGF